MYNQDHPECKEDEEFMGNVNHEHFEQSQLLTKRLGLIAYMTDGRRSTSDGVYPMFAKKEEMEYIERYFDLLGTPEQIPRYRDLHPELVTYKAGGFYKGEFDTYLKPDK